MTELAPACGACVAPAALEPPLYEPTTFVRHVAHELRHPLSTIESIALYLDIVLPRTEGRARRQLAKLRREVQQANWILADAIHFLGTAPARPELVDLSEAVWRKTPECVSAGPPPVRFDLEPRLPLVGLDLERFDHLLRNLLQLFRRVSRSTDEIVVTTSEREGDVLLEIRSTALIGAPDELRRMFDPFEPVSTSGLALASVRAICSAHRARLDAYADADGSGVMIAFPAAS